MSRLAAALVVALAACGHSSSPTPPTSAGAESATATAAPVAVPEGPGKVVDASFASAALGVTKNYKVYLPAGYDTLSSRRYPVVYMLHGLGGDETNWLDGGKLDAVADQLRLQAIVVMPDGDDSFYANSATPADKDACLARRPPFSDGQRVEDYCVATAHYEDYIVTDLVAHVDTTYRTIAERRGRGIGGLSMGGFGALQLAMRHKDVFAATASHSGVDALLYVGPHPYVADQVVLLKDVTSWGRGVGPIGDLIRGIFGTEAANWHRHDPATLAKDLKPGELAIYLDCGTEDFFQLHDGAQYLHDLLTARGVEHQWYLGPGRHDFSFWGERIDDSLVFFTKELAPATP
jgi:enterochelin esterase family protein